MSPETQETQDFCPAWVLPRPREPPARTGLAVPAPASFAEAVGCSIPVLDLSPGGLGEAAAASISARGTLMGSLLLGSQCL